VHPDDRNRPSLDQPDADNPILALAWRWTAGDRTAVEQVAGVPKVKATLLQGLKPLPFIPLKLHRRKLSTLHVSVILFGI